MCDGRKLQNNMYRTKSNRIAKREMLGWGARERKRMDKVKFKHF